MMIEHLVKTCSKCGRKWYLAPYKLPARDSDYTSCRCGEVLHSWSEAASYIPVQIFDDPAITKTPLDSINPAIQFPAGTAISVTPDSRKGGRVIRVEEQTYVVPEADLLRAMGDPYEGR